MIFFFFYFLNGCSAKYNLPEGKDLHLANNPSQINLQITADITTALKINLSLTFKHINYRYNYTVTASIYIEDCQLLPLLCKVGVFQIPPLCIRALFNSILTIHDFINVQSYMNYPWRY